jgi:hypothetical protein
MDEGKEVIMIYLLGIGSFALLFAIGAGAAMLVIGL